LPGIGRTFVLLCIASITYAAKPVHEGKVVGVKDGDTIVILTHSKQQIKIRLAEIDAPEQSQAFGQRSKQKSV
jgi:endonuclease YncB( thermonuclease family)